MQTNLCKYVKKNKSKNNTEVVIFAISLLFIIFISTQIFALSQEMIGLDSKMHQSLVIYVIGGLLINTLLKLNVLPVLYCSLEDLFYKKKNKP